MYNNFSKYININKEKRYIPVLTDERQLTSHPVTTTKLCYTVHIYFPNPELIGFNQIRHQNSKLFSIRLLRRDPLKSDIKIRASLSGQYNSEERTVHCTTDSQLYYCVLYYTDTVPTRALYCCITLRIVRCTATVRCTVQCTVHVRPV